MHTGTSIGAHTNAVVTFTAPCLLLTQKLKGERWFPRAQSKVAGKTDEASWFVVMGSPQWWQCSSQLITRQKT